MAATLVQRRPSLASRALSMNSTGRYGTAVRLAPVLRCLAILPKHTGRRGSAVDVTIDNSEVLLSSPSGSATEETSGLENRQNKKTRRMESGGSLYRWETSTGLYHSCGTCGMKANDPKARQHCYGIHQEPCASYHHTMFFVGQGHRCEACRKRDELHELRHREIATLVAEYRDSRKPEEGTPVSRQRKRSRSVTFFPDIDNNNGEEVGLRDNRAEVGADDNSSFSSAPTDSTDKAKTTKAEVREAKKQSKQAKSQSKALKNQSKLTVSVRSDDIVRVAKAIHGESYGDKAQSTHPLATDQDVEAVINRNLGFVSAIRDHKRLLLHSISQKRRKPQRSEKEKTSRVDDETEDLVHAILAQFDIVTCAPSKSSTTKLKGPQTPRTLRGGARSTATILQKLRDAVREDIEKHENEQRETHKRCAGFWRYVGRQVFERMTANCREVDWKSGVNLKRAGSSSDEAGGADKGEDEIDAAEEDQE